jgi:uncharacterized membrane protein YidH (DUF202 family)
MVFLHTGTIGIGSLFKEDTTLKRVESQGVYKVIMTIAMIGITIIAAGGTAAIIATTNITRIYVANEEIRSYNCKDGSLFISVSLFLFHTYLI